MFARNKCIRCISKQQFHKSLSGQSLQVTSSRRIQSTTAAVQNTESETKTTPQEPELPWYMRAEESPNLSSPLRQIEIPDIPIDAPHALQPMVEFIAKELGITDLELFDLRSPDTNQVNEGAEVLSDFMVIGTGKSSKHLQKATSELNFFIKSNLKRIPKSEGLLTAGQLAKYQRRLRKKGKKGPAYAHNDYGAAANTWVMMDCKIDGIYVHFLTAERRDSLNLESLWAKDKSKYKKEPEFRSSDDIFSGLRYFSTVNTNNKKSSARILKQINQLSLYSTIVNDSPSFNPEVITRENYSTKFNELLRYHLDNPQQCPLRKVENHLKLMQANGLPLTVANEIKPLIELILQSPEFRNDASSYTPDEIFQYRYSYISNIIDLFNPVITKSDLESLFPLLVVSGSQLDNDDFILLNQTDEKSNNIVLKHANLLNKLYHFSNAIHDRDNLGSKTQLDLMFLTVFLNSKNWNLSRILIDNAIKQSSIEPCIAALKLLSAKGSPIFCKDFVDNYLPLLMSNEQFDIQVYKQQVLEILNRFDKEGLYYQEVRGKISEN